MERGPRYRFEIHDPFEAACAEAGIASVADVLAKAECIRDLERRANLRLRVGDRLVHVKHYKRRPFRPWTDCHESNGLIWAMVHDLPVPRWVFVGYDRALGSVCGTLDLAPAAPLDDLLRQGRLRGAARRGTRVHLAAFVAALHQLHAHHKDLYLNHVFVHPDSEEPLVAVIDWDRLGAHRRPFGRWVVKDLAALRVSVPEGTVGRVEMLGFLGEYVLLRTGERDHGLVRRLASRVEAKAARMRRHVPRTPVGEAARPTGLRAGGDAS